MAFVLFHMLLKISHLISSLMQIEEVYGICDPNPTEYIETYAKQPNIVFYWGLQLRTINVSDIESVETNFLKKLNSGSFQGPVGRIHLSVVKASQLPRNGDCASNNRSKQVTKACWRIREDKRCKKVPVYSKHLPGYVVGYEKMDNREAEGMEVKC